MTTRPVLLLELQTAIEARLTGDATLMALINGVFDVDSVPVNQPIDYITYDTPVDVPLPTFGHMNSEATLTLSIWTLKHDAAYAVLAEVIRLLVFVPPNGAAPLVMPDYGQARLWCEHVTSMYVPDTRYWHLLAQFRSQAFELV